MAGAPKGNNNAGKNKPGVVPLQITLSFTQEQTEILRKAFHGDYNKWPESNIELGQFVRKFAKHSIEMYARGIVDWERWEDDG